ncbi:MAG: response regulator [Desulfobacteraceae bacterium]|nr:response regulator [Desulfobacteraceae bacterium]
MKETILIDTNEVMKLFNFSLESLRKYKALGLIKACAKIGSKDLFDKGDILIRKKIIESCKRNEKGLDEIIKYIKAYEIDKNIEFEFKNFSRTKKLLIIEDDESVCEFLKTYLMRAFFVNELIIFCATDGISGIKIAREMPQDLIIIDMVLDVGMDGSSVYKELIKDPRNYQSKFIFISGNFEFKSKNGIFFKKPINMKKFVDKIEELIDLKKNQAKKAFY